MVPCGCPQDAGMQLCSILNLFAGVKIRRVKLQVEVFDRFDGARPGTSAQATQPLSAKDPDGRLWFANQVVVQMINPNQFYTNRVPPPVHIEKLAADHKDYELGNQVGLPALTRTLRSTTRD
jgi:hypothetical protein